MNEELLNKIKVILDGNDDFNIRIAIKDLVGEHEITKDLGLDSLGIMSLVYELQEEFPDLDEGKMAQWKSLNDLIEEMKAHV